MTAEIPASRILALVAGDHGFTLAFHHVRAGQHRLVDRQLTTAMVALQGVNHWMSSCRGIGGIGEEDRVDACHSREARWPGRPSTNGGGIEAESFG